LQAFLVNMLILLQIPSENQQTVLGWSPCWQSWQIPADHGDSPRWAGEAISGGCKNREKPLRSHGKSRHFPISSWYLHDIYWFHLGSQFMDPPKNRKFEGKSSTLRRGRRHGLAKGEAGPVDWTMCRDLSGSVRKKRRVQSMDILGWLVGWLIMVNQWLWLIMVNHGMHTFLILRSSDLCWFWYMLVVIGCHGFRCVFLVYVQLDKANIREYSDRRLKALRVEVIVSLSMGSMFTVLMFWHPYNLWLCSDLSSNHSKIQGHDVWMILNVVDPFLFGLSLNSIRSTAKSTHVRQGLSLMGTLKR
jgi:predicted nucleic acid-binding Zn ribbon protein